MSSMEMTREEGEQFLEYTLEIGRRMVQCGSEVRRVEDTISRIASAYGFQVLCAYSLTAIIDVTIKDQKGNHYAQSVRVETGATDLGMLEQLNALARRICNEVPAVCELGKMIDEAHNDKKIDKKEWLGYVLAAISFAIFFGGSFLEGIASGVIAIGIFFMDSSLHLRKQNKIIYTGIASFISGALALLFVRLGFGSEADHIMIGDVMLFIPTLSLCNGVREMFYRDVLTGLYRLIEALIITIAIAAGFGASVLLFGGAFHVG